MITTGIKIFGLICAILSCTVKTTMDEVKEISKAPTKIITEDVGAIKKGTGKVWGFTKFVGGKLKDLVNSSE